MNKRTTNLLLTIVLAVVLTVIAEMFVLSLPISGEVVRFMLAPWPIIYISLRYGPATGIVTGALSGMIYGVTNYRLTDWMIIILFTMLPLLMGGLAGLFAKNTQKTLNNRRYRSTYLNIWTGSFIVYLAYTLSKYLMIPMLMQIPNVNTANLGNWAFWVSILVSWAIGALVVSFIARSNPNFIIPKRSRYLSRRETSSLLND